MTKPSGLVAAFAESVESKWQDDMKVQYSGREVLDLGSRLDNRMTDLKGAIANRMGVKEHAARVGALLVQLHHVGDERAPEPELPFKPGPDHDGNGEVIEDEEEDDDADMAAIGAKMGKKGSPRAKT